MGSHPAFVDPSGGDCRRRDSSDSRQHHLDSWHVAVHVDPWRYGRPEEEEAVGDIEEARETLDTIEQIEKVGHLDDNAQLSESVSSC